MSMLRMATLCAAIATMLEFIVGTVQMFESDTLHYLAHANALAWAGQIVYRLTTVALSVFFFALYARQKA